MNNKGKCPKCGSESFATERRPNGDSVCSKCHFSGKTTEFYKIDKEPEKSKMKFSEIKFKVVTDSPKRNQLIVDMINKFLTDRVCFGDDRAKAIKITNASLFYYLTQHIDEVEGDVKEVTFEEAIKILESCEPVVKKPSGKFVEYDIDEKGCYHPLNDRGSSSNCRWQDVHHYEDVNRIFAGWFWENPENSEHKMFSMRRYGVDNGELTLDCGSWEYPLVPTKIRFWVKE